MAADELAPVGKDAPIILPAPEASLRAETTRHGTVSDHDQRVTALAAAAREGLAATDGGHAGAKTDVFGSFAFVGSISR